MDPTAHPPVDRTFSFGPFNLVPARQLLLRDGTPVRLGSRALSILTALVERPGELVSRDELMAAAWPKLFVHESNLKVNMANLRRSLGDTQREPTYVATVIGRGYRFVAPVEIGAPANSQKSAEPGGANLSRLPAPREIVGRDEEIARIVAELRKRQHVTVVGAGGIGKTTVAIAAAQALEAEYPDGACFVDLSTFDDPTLLPSALAAALGIRGSADDMLTAVIDHLGQRQMLVLLDNCEHVLPAAAIFARRFAASVGRSRLLATSRQPLGTFAERIIRMDPLKVPDAVDGLTIEEAMRFPAMGLFARRAAEWAGYELVQSDCAAVAQICRSLDGIPLAIELAAANMVDRTAAQLGAMLDQHLGFQNRRIQGQPARHETLLATIDWSYKLLPQNEAIVLRIVSVFASWFDPVEAAAVAEPTDIGPVDVTICLGSLVAKSLLAAEVGGASLRYRLLDSTRRYALERLREDPMESDVRLRHAENVLAIFEQSEREWERHETDGWTGRYLERLPDLRAVLAWAFGLGRCTALGARLVKASLPFWFAVALLSEALTWVEDALNHAEDSSGDLTKTKLACTRAWLLEYARKGLAETENAWLHAISLARRSGDVGCQLDALVGLAFHSMTIGDLAESAKWLNEVRELSPRHQNWSAAPEGERLLAWLKVHTGELAESRQILDRMVARYPRPNSEAGLAGFRIDPYIWTRWYLPLCTWLMGQPDYAATVAREGVNVAGEVRNFLAQSSALTMGALLVAFFSGDQDALAAHLAQLQSIRRQRTSAVWIYYERFFAAVLKDLRGDASAAADMQAAIRSLLESNLRLRIGMCFGVLADMLARQGRIAEADDAIARAIQYQVRQNERWCRPELLRIKASILGRTGQHSAMEATLHDALKEARAIGALSFELRVANDLAAHYLGLDRRDDAVQLLLPIFRRFSEGFGTKDLVVASHLLERMGVASASPDRNVEPGGANLSRLPPAQEIVGRDEEIARIVAELRKRQHVTVVGAGGIGKTTVAIAAAQALEADYSDGACFVDLSTFDDPTLLPSALASALGIRGKADDMLTAVIDYLGQRQMLVLLDNCEHVLPAAAIFARRFAASVGRSRLLATSRQPLGTFAEHVVRLDPLTLPGTTDGLTIGEATRFSALDLFARRAAEWAGYELVDSDCAAVAQVCRLLDGLPLAIELAAANMADHSAAELGAMLDEHLGFQNWRNDGQPARHETLLATIDWSYKLLPQNEATLFRIVSVFASAFDPIEVAAVAEPTAIGPVDVTICLGSLVAKSLLTAEVVGAGLRYRLLDSTRRFALERLREDPIEGDVRLHYAERVLAIFEQSEREWERKETDGWTGRYLDRLPDLRAVLTWAFGPGRSPDLGVRLVKASLPFWFAVALMSEALTRVEEALNHAESTSDDLLKTRLACSRGWILLYSRSRTSQIEVAWLAAISLARRAGDAGYLLDALAGLAHYYLDTGRIPEGAKRVNEYGELAAGHQNWSLEGLRALAWLKVHTGELAEGRQILDSMAARYPRPNSEAASQRASAPLASFRIHPYIGARYYLPLCAWLMGQREYAAVLAREAFDVAGKTRHLVAQANALGFAALPVALLNRDVDALSAYLEQLQFIHRQGPPGRWTYAEQFFTAALKDLRGDPDAVADLQAATRSLVENNFLREIGMWLGVLADALARQGRTEEASDVISKAMQYRERWCRSELLRIKASILRRTGQHATIEPTLHDALKEARAIGALSFELKVANDLAAHYLDLSRRDDAVQLLRPIFRRFSEGFGTKDLVVASQLLKRMGVATD